MNEIDRNLHDSLMVVRNVMQESRMMPGGGATEMALACVRNTFSYSQFLVNVSKCGGKQFLLCNEPISEIFVINKLLMSL